MTVIRTNFLPEFDFGYDAVLLTLDGAGVSTIRSALSDALQRGSSHFEHDDVTYDFIIEADRADITVDKTRVVWRLDPAKAREISDNLAPLAGTGNSGHNYIDMSSPAPTLVVSRDEYVDVIYPWISPPSPANQPHCT